MFSVITIYYILYNTKHLHFIKTTVTKIIKNLTDWLRSQMDTGKWI